MAIQFFCPFLVIAAIKGVFCAVVIGSCGLWLAIPLGIAIVSIGFSLISKAYSVLNSYTNTRQQVENQIIKESPSFLVELQEKVMKQTDTFFEELKMYNTLLRLPKNMNQWGSQVDFLLSTYVDTYTLKKSQKLTSKAEQASLSSPADYVVFFEQNFSFIKLRKKLEIGLSDLFLKEECSQLTEFDREKIVYQTALRIAEKLQDEWLKKRVLTLFLDSIIECMNRKEGQVSLNETIEEFSEDQKGLLHDLKYAKNYVKNQIGKQNEGVTVGFEDAWSGWTKAAEAFV